jgi:hypothetical protein
MKEEFNKDIEMLKNENLNIPNKNLNQNTCKQTKQMENKISGIENKVVELDQSVKDNKKHQENMNGTCKTSETPLKDKT